MTNPEDPAFETARYDPGLVDYKPSSICIGLTKREYFSGIALRGLLSSGGHFEFLKATKMQGEEARAFTAKTAIQMADALIAELNKTTGAKP